MAAVFWVCHRNYVVSNPFQDSAILELAAWVSPLVSSNYTSLGLVSTLKTLCRLSLTLVCITTAPLLIRLGTKTERYLKNEEEYYVGVKEGRLADPGKIDICY